MEIGTEKELLELTLALAKIPAPSGEESERAAFCNFISFFKRIIRLNCFFHL